MNNNIWKKDSKMIELINKQYNLELKASNQYFYYATIAKKMGYDAVSTFYINLAQDKQGPHLLRILDYFMNINQEVNITCSSIPNKFDSYTIQELVKNTLEIEMSIRNLVDEICKYAMEIRDFETFEMEQWFVKDAIKDINDVLDISTIVNAPNASLLAIETSVHKKNKNSSKKLYE